MLPEESLVEDCADEHNWARCDVHDASRIPWFLVSYALCVLRFGKRKGFRRGWNESIQMNRFQPTRGERHPGKMSDLGVSRRNRGAQFERLKNIDSCRDAVACSAQ